MIDYKKIEDAAKQHSEESYISSYFQACYKDAFMDGVKWAINEFIKDLWHPANKVPEIGRVIIMENYYPDGRIMFISSMRKSTFHNPIDIGNTKNGFILRIYFLRKEVNMIKPVTMYSVVCDRCGKQFIDEFNIKGIKIRAASKKDSFKKYNHCKK